MKATYFSAAALAALPSIGAAQLLNLAAASSAAPQVTTGYSTTTSTRTVLHVITETHFSSIELETSTELIPVVTPTPTPSPINIQAAVATPVSSFPTLSVVANSTQGFNGTSKASQTAGAAGVNVAAAGAASASASPAPTGAASALQISGAAVAAMAAAAGFFVL